MKILVLNAVLQNCVKRDRTLTFCPSAEKIDQLIDLALKTSWAFISDLFFIKTEDILTLQACHFLLRRDKIMILKTLLVWNRK